MAATKDKGSRPRFRNLPVEAIMVDDRYQRGLSLPRVKRIVRNFDWQEFGAIEVSLHADGTYTVFDGQHRLAALRELGFADAPCLLHQLTPEREAALFVRMQLDRKSPTHIERFNAQVFAGNPESVEISTIVDDTGFQVTRSSSPYGIRAVNRLEQIYRREGAAVLYAALRFVADTWGGDDRSTDGPLLEGVAQFLRGYGNRLDDETRGRLAATSPTVILRRALGVVHPGGGTFARHAVDAELRKVAGVRGKPTLQPSLKLAA